MDNELLQAIGQMISVNSRKMTEEMSSMMDSKLEPINSRLDHIEQDVSGLKQGQADLQQDISEINQRTTKIESTVVNLNERTTRIEVILENDIKKSLQLIEEGHSGNVDKLRKLDSIETIVDDTKDKVDVIFQVVKNHSSDIKDLKLIK